MNKVGIIVSARMGSTRLPGKAMRQIKQTPMIQVLLERLVRTTSVPVILATTSKIEDDVLENVAKELQIDVFRGEEHDVLKRLLDCGEKYGFDYIVRVTGDCPFVNGELIEYVISQVVDVDEFDIASTKGQFPVGLDCEIFNCNTLQALYDSDQLSDEHKEHVTLALYEKSRNVKNIQIKPKLEWDIRDKVFTVDTPEDFIQAALVFDAFRTPFFSIQELVQQVKHDNLLEAFQ